MCDEDRRRIQLLEEALRPLADLAYGFKAYPQGLAGQDPLLGVMQMDALKLRERAKSALVLLNSENTASEQVKDGER